MSRESPIVIVVACAVVAASPIASAVSQSDFRFIGPSQEKVLGAMSNGAGRPKNLKMVSANPTLNRYARENIRVNLAVRKGLSTDCGPHSAAAWIRLDG